MSEGEFAFEVLDGVSQLVRHDYEQLGGTLEYPFLNLSFLLSLEKSGVLGADSGWIPRHLALLHAGKLVGFVPGYIKLHSYGEFVFDHGWAQCSELQLGTPYYPKYVVGVPYTPTTGPRFLLNRSLAPEERHRAIAGLASAVTELCQQMQLSSAHVLFCDEELVDILQDEGWVKRLGVQYQFHNQGYESFDQFLQTFRAKRRANIRRERREVHERGWTIDMRTGDELTPGDAKLAYQLYLTTVDKYVWGRRYLNQEFFELLFRDMPDLIHFVTAKDGEGRVVAGAFNLIGQDAIFGRYWGTFVEEPFLHFEVCLYSGIEDTILRGLARFEAGAGGEHKHGRGLVPTVTRSLHFIRHPTLGRLVAEFCAHEAEQIESSCGPE